MCVTALFGLRIHTAGYCSNDDNDDDNDNDDGDDEVDNAAGRGG